MTFFLISIICIIVSFAYLFWINSQSSSYEKDGFVGMILMAPALLIIAVFLLLSNLVLGHPDSREK